MTKTQQQVVHALLTEQVERNITPDGEIHVMEAGEFEYFFRDEEYSYSATIKELKLAVIAAGNPKIVGHGLPPVFEKDYADTYPIDQPVNIELMF